MNRYAVIVADGSFPAHTIPLKEIDQAEFIISCDGATENLVKHGFTPDLIIGDLDSISEQYKKQFADRLVQVIDQDTNDLTKAVNWAHQNEFHQIIIVGATGKREDHTLGNISLLYTYARIMDVKMITDTGVFIPVKSNSYVKCKKGQQISIFSNNPNLKISSFNLKYPLYKMTLNELWMGTLNETLTDNFKLEFEDGEVIVFIIL